MFTRRTFKEVNNANRGPYGRVNLELIQGAVGHSCKAIRTIGVREQIFYEKTKDSKNQGFLRPLGADENSDWVSRACLVPKPNGKWRLVIDYRYLNTQLKGINFPLPVIKDELARQMGKSVFSLVDLEDRFHQMHLEPSCCHLTAFITPFGVYEWLVLPIGVQVGPQVFQRLVQWVLRTCPHSGPCIDDVLTGTGDPQGPRTSFCGVGRLSDSQAYQDEDAAQFLQPCFSPPPVLPDGSRNPDMATPYFYDFPETPFQRDRLYFHYLCLREVFNAFAQADLTVKPSTCFLLTEQVQYVRHVLRNGKRFSSPAKYEALREWKQKHITTAKALKGFLGLANWYSMYIHNLPSMQPPSWRP